MVGRGMRPKKHTDHCLVLDFAGVVDEHGPITAIRPPRRKGEAEGGKAPTKACPKCEEILHASVKACTACGHEFEQIDKSAELTLRHDADIMGESEKAPQVMRVGQWKWRIHTSRTTGKEMLRVTYYPEGLSGDKVDEYLAVAHEGYAQKKALQRLAEIARGAGVSWAEVGNSMETACDAFDDAPAPTEVVYVADGKFKRVVECRWAQVDPPF
jgi:DNA repair protein RadD